MVKRFRKYLFSAHLVISVILVTYWVRSTCVVRKLRQRPDNATKYILFWNDMFHSKAVDFGITGYEPFKNCKYDKCFATFDRSLLLQTEFDAVLFHGAQYSAWKGDVPSSRTSNQVYVFVNMESPTGTMYISGEHFPQMKNFFNWTMTYRRDSDIFHPYGRVFKRNTNYTLPAAKDMAKKKKLVAWFVSNCSAKIRRAYAESLQKYLPVDIYGACGPLKCTCSEKIGCLKMIEEEYKFYLSFENSFCAEYVTEKVFEKLKLNVVPIVYGAANYDLIVPPHSVINVNNFTSAQKLAEYLLFLDNHNDKYLEYFEWKKTHIIDETSDIEICELCEKLHTRQNSVKMYEDINYWWTGQNDEMCADAAHDFDPWYLGLSWPKIIHYILSKTFNVPF